MRSFKQNIYRLNTQDAYDCDILSGTAVETPYSYMGTANPQTLYTGACATPLGAFYWMTIPMTAINTYSEDGIGRKVYTNSELTTVLSGGGQWYAIREVNTSITRAIRVDSLGSIMAIENCT